MRTQPGDSLWHCGVLQFQDGNVLDLSDGIQQQVCRRRQIGAVKYGCGRSGFLCQGGAQSRQLLDRIPFEDFGDTGRQLRLPAQVHGQFPGCLLWVGEPAGE